MRFDARPLSAALVWSALVCLLGSGCNAVLGIDKASLDTTTGAIACVGEGTMACANPTDAGAGSTILACKGGFYTEVGVCPNGGICTSDPGSEEISCGAEAYATAAGPCSANGFACSVDHLVVLECVSGSWLESRHCTPSTCGLVSGAVECANGGYAVGDRCAFDQLATICSADRREIVSCQNRTTVAIQNCVGSTTCVPAAGTSPPTCK